MALTNDQTIALVGKQQIQIEQLYLIIKQLSGENDQLKARLDQPEKAEDGDAKE